MATLKVNNIRGRFYICAGVSKLSRGFRSEAAARAELDKNRGLYEYWAGSAGVSLENTTPRVVKVGS